MEPGIENRYGPGNDWSRFLARTQQSLLRVGDTELSFVELPGSGTPIVFLHGIGNTWRFWCSQLEAFEGRNRLVAVDLPGFGDSSMPEAELTAEVAGAAVAALCDQLDVARCVLVGHSMGALAALSIAANYPELVIRVVAVAPALQGVIELHSGVRAVASAPRLASRYGYALAAGAFPLPRWMRGAIASGGPMRRLTLRTFVKHPDLLDEDVVEACLEGLGSAGVMAVARAARQFDLIAVASQVTRPVDLVNGRDDKLSTPEHLAALAGALRVSRYLLIDDAGHWPMIERGPQFNDILAASLAEPHQAG